MITKITHIAIGAIMLLLGISIYLIFRPTDATFIFGHLPYLYGLYIKLPIPLLLITGSLPTFFHVCSFSIISYQFVSPQTSAMGAIISSFWVLINLLAEYGQLACQVDPFIFSGTNQIIANYFCYGHYDDNDIVAALLGGVFSFLILNKTKGQK